MISSIVSHDEEIQVNGAFANIGLIADKVWAHDKEDPYRKLNQSLWVQNRKLSLTYDGNSGKTTRVRDVIPTSRLAQYGNYEYVEERERMYKSDDATPRTELRNETNEKKLVWPNDHRGRCAEPWMLRQVEEYFVRLVSPSPSYSSLSKIHHFYCDEESGKYPSPIPYTIDDNTELQLEARVSSKIVKDLWKAERSPGESCRVQRSRTNAGLQAAITLHEYLLTEGKLHKSRRHDDKRLEVRKNCQQSSCTLRTDKTSKSKLHTVIPVNPTIPRPVVPLLSPEVAEFFPKAPITLGEEERRGPLPFFPSSSEPSYQDELFPYNQTHFPSAPMFPHNSGGLAIAVSHPTTLNTWIRTPHQWIHRIVPPIQIQVPSCATTNHPPIYTAAIQPFCPTTIVHRPINVHEKIFTPLQAANPAPIPVYQRPVELYPDSSQRRVKSHHQGVDFNNLILLTKNAMKARRNQSKNPQQTSSFILESRQPNLKSESDVLQWLNKGYPKRAHEFVTVNSLVRELNAFEEKCDSTRSVTTSTTIVGQVRDSFDTEHSNIREKLVLDDSDVPMITKKRLYRDVLTNTVSTEIILETVLDKRYDELEQQAMEQYRTSEECLALRYQELERQALEQYKYSDSSSESIRAICSSTLCTERRNKDETEAREYENSESSENGRGQLSGFETRIDVGTSPFKNTCTTCGDKGPGMERPITILRSDHKCASVPSAVVTDANGQNYSNARGTTVVTKSLTALSHECFDMTTKNTTKGASGDKLEEQAQTSINNRHLILLSPVKQSIPTIKSETISVSQISGYCAKPVKIGTRGIPNGGGDDKITILHTPGAQVWLSNFWR